MPKNKAMSQTEYLLDVREKYIRKSNDLIQKSRFSLSIQEQKIILFLISKIKPEDEDFKTYTFSIAEFCQVCGIERSGKEQKIIKDEIKQIADQSMWVETAPGKEILLRWINDPGIDTNTGVITVEFSRNMRPYLLQLKERYTEYQLIYSIQFKSKYALRLYEWICSIHYNVFKPYTYTLTVDELKKRIGAENYAAFKNFKQRALIPAIKEINEYSDKLIDIEYLEGYGKGRPVKAIKFKVQTKPRTDLDRIRADIDRRMKVDYQYSIWQQMEKIENER